MCEIDVMNISSGTFEFNPKPAFPDDHCPMYVSTLKGRKNRTFGAVFLGSNITLGHLEK